MSIIDRITKSISNVFLISLVACYIAAGALIVYFINGQMKKQALHDAGDRARLLLNRSLAEHDYFNNRMKPRLFDVTNGSIDKDYFDPCWMASTYAVREMDKNLKDRLNENYYYKEAAIGARSVEDEADTYEAKYIQQLNHGSNIKEIQEIRKINGVNYFTYMIPGETITESCLRCHSNPQTAPKMMLKIYGDTKSFNRKIGEVVSVISVRIPLEEAYSAANAFSARLIMIFLLVLFVLLLTQFLIYKRIVQLPINTVKSKALEIVNSKEHLGEQIPIYYENELGDLTRAFNWLSRNMRELLDGLEIKIKERTEKYEKANHELTEQIQNRLKVGTALRESEERYRRLIEISPSAIGVIADSKIVFANSSSLKILGGADKSGIIGKDIGRFIYPASRKSKIVGLLDKIKQSNRIFTSETQIMDLSGNIIPVEVFMVPTVFNGKSAVQMVVNNIEYRKRTEQALKLSEQQFRSIFDNSPVGIAISLKNRVIKANKSFTEMFGYFGASEIEGVSIGELLSNTSLEEGSLQNTYWDKDRHDNRFYELNGIKKGREVFPVNAGFARINLPEGDAVVAMISDRTELKNREEEVKSSLKEKETLLKEIHHRVKNNLQVISSLLNLQMQFIEDEKLKILFNDSCSRVRSMSLIHEKLYQTKSLSKINMKDYVLDLSMFLKSAYLRDSERIEIKTGLEEVLLPIDMAVPCGLIINELVSNALKHAFKGVKNGIIDIILRKDESMIEIAISDNGAGLPDNVDLNNSTSLGLQLVAGLVEQIRGTLSVVRNEGTKFCLKFPVE